MDHALAWYVAVQLLGLAVLPLSLKLFAGLPDRGYAFARPVGLGLVAYLLWLGSSFGIWQNRPAAVVAIGAIVAGLCWWRLRPERADLRRLWTEKRSLVLTVEGLFLAAFAFLVLVRAFVPDISGTEKPMELTFLNGVLRSDWFPPLDPWLSGYSISYYYLGYVMVAALAEVSRTPASVAFNLALPMLFALTVTGAFALGYNLVEGARERRSAMGGGEAESRGLGPMAVGGLASVFVAVLGNWEGFLELLHSHGIGSVAFWQWVGINGLTNAAYTSPVWYPTDAQDNWWWFRAARVIADYTGGPVARDYTINEFPYFSFVLGDMHPHVLALPFAFVVLGFALSLLRSPHLDWSWLLQPPPAPTWLQRPLGWPVVSQGLRYLALYPIEWIRRMPVLALGVGLLYGGLGFLNAWDMLTYLFVLVAAFAMLRWCARPVGDGVLVREVLSFGWLSIFLSLVLYAPFYVGFRSQASGLGVVVYRSQLHNFLIYWGPLLVLVVPLLVLGLRGRAGEGLAEGGLAGGKRDWTHSTLLWIVVADISVILLALKLPGIASAVSVMPWMQAPAVAVILPLLVAAVACLWRYLAARAPEPAPVGAVGESSPASAPAAAEVAPSKRPSMVPLAGLAREHCFVLVLVATALLLIFGTEFVFINDLFADRMNTVFKLYYQSWALLAVAGAYTVHYVLSRWRRSIAEGAGTAIRIAGWAWAAAVAIAVVLGLVYAPASTLSRTAAFGGSATLDGQAYMQRWQPADYAAIQWVRANVDGSPVIVEAGQSGSYTEFGRVSTSTGLPTLIGWDGHEAQWRGRSEDQAVRLRDVDTIYRSTDEAAVLALMEKYGVTYVFVGSLETQVYGAADQSGLDKFAGFMDTVYNRDGVAIYRVRE